MRQTQKEAGGTMRAREPAGPLSGSGAEMSTALFAGSSYICFANALDASSTAWTNVSTSSYVL
jgi:hypothetical protein